MSLISIIIPYFNKKKYIQQTLNSVLRQNYKNFEILIVYDDTSHKDLPFLKMLEKKDKRIKLIINKNNLGAGLSRNKAIKIAKGRYVAFLDSDDLWHPNKLQKQHKFMTKNKFDISHTSYKIIDKKNNKIGFRNAKRLEYKHLLTSCDIGLSTVMIKRSLLKKNFFPKIKTKEDYVLWLKLTKKNFIFYAIKEPLTSWRSLENSLSSSLVQKMIDGFCVYRIYLRQSFLKSMLSLIVLSINFLKK